MRQVYLMGGQRRSDKNTSPFETAVEPAPSAVEGRPPQGEVALPQQPRLGVAAFVTLNVVTTKEIPPGIQWVAIAPVGIGLSHLLVYLVGKKKES